MYLPQRFYIPFDCKIEVTRNIGKAPCAHTYIYILRSACANLVRYFHMLETPGSLANRGVGTLLFSRFSAREHGILLFMFSSRLWI